MGKMNWEKTGKFLKANGVYLVIFAVALAVFLASIQGEWNEHISYRQASKQGDLLGMGEMKVNEQGKIDSDGSVVLQTGGVLFGPYFDYEAGKYVLEITAEGVIETDQVVSITAGGGTTDLASFALQDGENILPVELHSDQKRIEIVVRNSTQDRLLSITKLRFYQGTLPEGVHPPQATRAPEKETLPETIEAVQVIDLLQQMLYGGVTMRDEGKIILAQDAYMYGPYMDLEAGQYQVHLDCEYDEQVGGLTVQITAENGSQILLAQDIRSGENLLHFETDKKAEGLEVIVRNEIFNQITISQIRLELTE